MLQYRQITFKDAREIRNLRHKEFQERCGELLKLDTPEYPRSDLKQRKWLADVYARVDTSAPVE